ncbi:MAG: translation elongation factor-like protein [Nanoarchaeota archaeon]
MGEQEIGEVSNYFEHVGAAAIKLKSSLKVGDVIHIHGGETHIEQKVESMQIDRKDVTSAKKGDEVGILIKGKARKGYKVFKV